MTTHTTVGSTPFGAVDEGSTFTLGPNADLWRYRKDSSALASRPHDQDSQRRVLFELAPARPVFFVEPPEGDPDDEDDRPSDADYRRMATEQYGGDDVQIDDDADISFTDFGAWVQAWVYVPDPGHMHEERDDSKEATG